jgi:hypothetical protein
MRRSVFTDPADVDRSVREVRAHGDQALLRLLPIGAWKRTDTR